MGSYDVNGSLRSIIESWHPAEYIGVDIENGPGVDMICNAEDLIKRFGKEVFDAVISTDLLEHVRDWKKVISNIKNVCKPNGVMLITTCSYGFKYHGYPYDFWRYEVEDMKEIFSDCIVERVEADKTGLGVFIKTKKPNNFHEKDLSGYKLYSIITDKRVGEIDEKILRVFQKRYIRRSKIKNRILKIAKFLFSKLIN